MAQGKVNYNYTLQEFPSEEAPGLSVFYKSTGGDVFHTYSTYGRGLEPLIGIYMILDLVPKGRDEDHLAFTMEWVRHHDRYGTGEFADANKPYWPPTASPSSVPQIALTPTSSTNSRAAAMVTLTSVRLSRM
jgi:hypothetical protein